MLSKVPGNFRLMIGFSLFYSSLALLLFGTLLVIFNQLLFRDPSHLRVIFPISGILLFTAAVFTLIAALNNRGSWLLCSLAVLSLTLLFYSPFITWFLPNANIEFLPGLQLFCWCLFIMGQLTGFKVRKLGIQRIKRMRSISNLCFGLLLVLVVFVILEDTGTIYGYKLGGAPSVALNTAIFLLFCALAGLTAPFASNFRLAEHKSSPGSWLALFLSIATMMLWLNFMHQLSITNKKVVAETTEKFQQQLDQIINEQRGLMYRLADRLASSSQSDFAHSLKLEFSSYLRDFTYLDYLAVVNASEQIQYSISKSEPESHWFDDYAMALTRIETQNDTVIEPHLSFFYDSEVDHTFIRALLPRPNASNLIEIIAGIDFQNIMNALVPVIVPPGYAITLAYQDKSSFFIDQRQSDLEYFGLAEFTVSLFGEQHWRLQLHRDLKSALNLTRQISEVLLLAGWLAAMLALLSQQYQRQILHQQRRLLSSNQRLQLNLEAKRKLQSQHQQIMDNTGDIICMIDRNCRFLEVSQSCEWVLGYKPAELLGGAFMDFVHPDDRLLTEQEAENIFQGHFTQYFRNRYVHKDGRIVYLMWSSRYDAGLGIMYAIARDITELVKAEHYQQMQQRILLSISNERSLAEILEQVSFLAEQQQPLVKASVMLKVGQHLKLISAPSFSPRYHSAFAELPIADNTGSCGTAAFQKSLVVVNDIATDAKWRASAPIALAEGVQACWSMPMISSQDEVLGTFALYCIEARAPNKDELELLVSCCRFAALAIARAQQKRLLTESEQRFRSLYQFSPDPIYVLSESGYFTNINEAGCQLLQRQLAELRNTHFNRVILPEQLPAVSAYFSKALAGEAVSFEASILNYSAQQLELQITIVPTWIDGRIAGVIGIAKDITQRLQTEKQLRLFKRAVDASASGVLIVDIILPDMPISYVNHAFEKLTGYSRDEVLGLNCRFLQGAERDELALQQIRSAIQARQECCVVLKNYRKDSSAFWNQLYLAPVPDEQGNITHYIGIQTDITAQRNYEQELAYNASYDLLTGLPNRSLFRDRLTQSCAISAKNKQKVAVLFIDLDGFKLINDSLGHLVGDEVLRQISSRLKRVWRPGDTLARLGGDEFVLIVPDLIEIEQLNEHANRILQVVSEPLQIEEHELQVTASIGISCTEYQLSEPMQLVQQADLAMYRAKQLGRNNYQWYTAEMETSLNKRINIRAMLKKALVKQEFVLYYQPQVEAGSGRLIGLEALLRWFHPEHGMIGPDEFIPIAEETGLIIELGEWVIEQAAAFNYSLQQLGFSPLIMAVNLSSLQFQRSGFVSQLEQTLKINKLEPRWFELELTESLLLENIDLVVNKLQRLKQLGIGVSIDDFGTGYSSLNYLKRLPIDKLKIDKSFIKELVTDQRDAAISRAIIAMAHQLGIKVIAEGVETEAQASFLAKSLCDELQGYYFAQPMPAEELKVFLTNYAPLSKEKSLIEPQTLLLVDDEENILHSLKRLLRKEPYQILCCGSAIEALELLALHQVQVIISDQRMPEMNGTEFLSRVKEMYPETIRLVLSGYTDLRSVTDAINHGAIYKYLTKPWQDEELKAEISAAFRRYREQQHLAVSE